MDALKAMLLETSREVAGIDARITDKLLKRACKQGMTDENDVIKLVEAWKLAASRGRGRSVPSVIKHT